MPIVCVYMLGYLSSFVLTITFYSTVSSAVNAIRKINVICFIFIYLLLLVLFSICVNALKSSTKKIFG